MRAILKDMEGLALGLRAKGWRLGYDKRKYNNNNNKN